MYEVSANFTAAIRSSFTAATKLTMTTPDGNVTDLQVEGGTVSVQGGTGPRWTAEVVVSANPGTNLYQQLAAEGTVFTLQHGVQFGTGPEYVPFGVYTAVKVPGVIGADQYRLSLADGWVGLEEARFLTPMQPASNLRRVVIASQVQSAFPGVEVVTQTSGGGSMDGSRVWEESRTDLIRDLAVDGALECYFDGAGRFVIRDAPAMSDQPPVGTPAFTLTTGDFGTILPGAMRERPLAKRYNAVVVRPSGADQTWTQRVAQVSDSDHPRHPSKIGVRPAFWSSPTITNSGEAMLAAFTRLQRILKAAQIMMVPATTNAALEPGDIGLLVYPGTASDERMDDDVQIEAIRFNLREGSMDVDLVAAGLVDMGDMS